MGRCDLGLAAWALCCDQGCLGIWDTTQNLDAARMINTFRLIIQNDVSWTWSMLFISNIFYFNCWSANSSVLTKWKIVSLCHTSCLGCWRKHLIHTFKVNPVNQYKADETVKVSLKVSLFCLLFFFFQKLKGVEYKMPMREICHGGSWSDTNTSIGNASETAPNFGIRYHEYASLCTVPIP